MKTEKSIEVFQKEKHTDIQIFTAKQWINDEVLRDTDYTQETDAAALMNQQKLNGCWVPFKNGGSTSNRGDNSLFCLFLKKQTNFSELSRYSAALQVCRPL